MNEIKIKRYRSQSVSQETGNEIYRNTGQPRI